MKGIKIAIANEKGGVGKSTISCLLASAIHFGYKDYKIGLFDVDPQQALFNKRLRESEKLIRDEAELAKYVEMLDDINKENIYDIYSANILTKEPLSIIQKYEKQLDFLIIDIPPYTDTLEMQQLLSCMDYILIPYDPTDLIHKATDTFLNRINSGSIKHMARKKITSYGIMSRLKKGNAKNISDFATAAAIFKNKFGMESFLHPLYDSPFFADTDLLDDNARQLVIEQQSEILKMHNISTEEYKLHSEKINKRSYINTLFPFPQTGASFEEVSPYPLIKEILSKIIKK